MFIPTGAACFKLSPALAPYSSELGRRAVVVSEFFPTSGWAVANAMVRNRLVAGVSDALVIVEAQAQGGTMATFQMAQQAGVATFAVDPGDRGPATAGNALAIANGSGMLRGPEDVGKILAAPGRGRARDRGTLW